MCRRAQSEQRKRFKHRQVASTPFPANRKISQMCSTMKNTNHKCVSQCKAKNTNVPSKRQAGRNESNEIQGNMKISKLCFTIRNTNISQFCITKHECITIFTIKLNCVPILKYKKPRAEQSKAWLLWFQTPVQLRIPSSVFPTISVKHLWYCYSSPTLVVLL